MVIEFSAEEIAAVRLSLRVVVWAMLGSLPFGLLTAIVLARGQFLGRSLLDAVVKLSLVGRHGLLGRFFAESFGSAFAFRWNGAVLGCAVMGFPLLVRAIRLSLEAVDRRLKGAAGTRRLSGD